MTVEELTRGLSVLQNGMTPDLGSGVLGVQLNAKGKGKVYIADKDNRETVFKFNNLRQLGVYMEQANG